MEEGDEGHSSGTPLLLAAGRSSAGGGLALVAGAIRERRLRREHGAGALDEEVPPRRGAVPPGSPRGDVRGGGREHRLARRAARLRLFLADRVGLAPLPDRRRER